MLSKEMLENIQNLLAITSSINETYGKLKELEINNKKESKEYQSLIEGLKSSLELEKFIYEKIPKDINVLTQIEQTICNSKDNWINFSLQDNINAILSHHDLVNLRINLKLFNIMLAIKNADFIINVNNNNVLENQSTRNILIINTTIIRDFINSILIILNSYLYDSKYNVIKDLLMDVKYSLSFVYEEIENDFLENNFNINNDLYWEATAIADYYRLDREKLSAIQRGTVYFLYNEKINDVIKISLDQESSKQEIFEYTIGEILVRASLLLFGDKTVNYLRNQKVQLAPDVPHTKEWQENLKNAQKRLDNVLNMYDKDKELLQVISLKVR